jgi:hypothetical protein
MPEFFKLWYLVSLMAVFLRDLTAGTPVFVFSLRFLYKKIPEIKRAAAIINIISNGFVFIGFHSKIFFN